MNKQQNKILTTLFAGMEESITEKILQQLREVIVDDITAIVKEILKKNELYNKINSSANWITIDGVCKKYNTSRKTVTDKCKIFKEGLFKIKRKWVGKHHLLDEQDFLIACEQKEGKKLPKFLKNKKASAD